MRCGEERGDGELTMPSMMSTMRLLSMVRRLVGSHSFLRMIAEDIWWPWPLVIQRWRRGSLPSSCPRARQEVESSVSLHGDSRVSWGSAQKLYALTCVKGCSFSHLFGQADQSIKAIDRNSSFKRVDCFESSLYMASLSHQCCGQRTSILPAMSAACQAGHGSPSLRQLFDLEMMNR